MLVWVVVKRLQTAHVEATVFVFSSKEIARSFINKQNDPLSYTLAEADVDAVHIDD
jgi:hypothetical protein